MTYNLTATNTEQVIKLLKREWGGLSFPCGMSDSQVEERFLTQIVGLCVVFALETVLQKVQTLEKSLKSDLRKNFGYKFISGGKNTIEINNVRNCFCSFSFPQWPIRTSEPHDAFRKCFIGMKCDFITCLPKLSAKVCTPLGRKKRHSIWISIHFCLFFLLSPFFSFIAATTSLIFTNPTKYIYIYI